MPATYIEPCGRAFLFINLLIIFLYTNLACFIVLPFLHPFFAVFVLLYLSQIFILRPEFTAHGKFPWFIKTFPYIASGRKHLLLSIAPVPDSLKQVPVSPVNVQTAGRECAYSSLENIHYAATVRNAPADKLIKMQVHT